MAWRIGDDELAMICVKKPIGNIDGNALLSLSNKSIH